jgi:hypothetical protein
MLLAAVSSALDTSLKKTAIIKYIGAVYILLKVNIKQ